MSEAKHDETLTPEQIENWKKTLGAPDMTDEEVQVMRDDMQAGLDNNELEFQKIEYCPACGADLTGKEIPEESRQHYGDHTHFSRKIGIYDRDRDMTVEWQCPDCGHRWPRDFGQVQRGFRTHG